MIQTFLHIVRLASQQQLTYRTAIVSGLLTNLFFGLLRAFVLIALYQGRGEVNGLTLHGAITYVTFSQGMIAFLSIFGSWDLMNSVNSGEVATDLLKPMPLFLLWMGRDLGRSLVNLVGRGLLLMLAMSIFFPIYVPQRFGQWVGLLLALGLGWLVSYAFRFLVNLAAFWSPDARGFGRIAFTLSSLFSGFLMPLRLYPDWFVWLCHLTPFPALFNTSVEAYLGILNTQELGLGLLGQVIWLIILVGLCQVVAAAGIRRLVVQGG